MKKNANIFIEHILESIQLIEEYSLHLTDDTFKKNKAAQDAIIRRLEIIGEAAKNVPLSIKERYSNIPWKQMAGMRDVLIHEYFDVDLALTWTVVKRELPLVKEKLQDILTSTPEN